MIVHLKQEKKLDNLAQYTLLNRPLPKFSDQHHTHTHASYTNTYINCFRCLLSRKFVMFRGRQKKKRDYLVIKVGLRKRK